MINFPKENLDTLNFYTFGHKFPMVIASYSSQEQESIDKLDLKTKNDQKALRTWCIRNHHRFQVLRYL